ncbi:hypothetical protein KIL84_001919 [Mauremys mutica]|uniref:Uncharacterized protein n=1 Tax=Mauremys mutica TaxID=74926 RepID=A0A9D3XKU4_9SAUR|nr:hypothetical protein KIL84_001919 [Mauremys mutica]
MLTNPSRFKEQTPSFGDPEIQEFTELDQEEEEKVRPGGEGTVIVDNKPFYEYSHRIPIEQVKILQVTWPVELQQIEIFKDSNISSSTSSETK